MMRRRAFIALTGGAAAAWPLSARAQQPALPVVGSLRSASRAAIPHLEAAFREGLRSAGFVEDRNLVIDYRYADSRRDLLPAMAADLVRRQVAVIYASDNATAVVAKAATTAIPIVFRIGADPVQLGLVASLNRPGGNVTGVSFLSTITGGIRLQMLREVVPQATVMGLLVNSDNPNAELDTREAQDAARKLGLDLRVVSASSAQQIDAAFATLAEARAQALVIDGDTFFNDRRQQLAALALRQKLPAASAVRDFPDAGGLMSYGASNADADRLAGIYVGRVLKGEKPADLPVQQSIKVELVINLKTAKALGLTMPLTLLGRADEVIE